MHNFSTPQHQYDHRGISSPLGGGDDLHGGRDSTHGAGVGDATHVERDDIHGGGDDIHGGGDLTHRDDTHCTPVELHTPPPLGVDTSVGDGTLQEYLAVKDEREQRMKIRSRYMSTPYTDPFQVEDKERKKLMAKYKRFLEGKNDIS